MKNNRYLERICRSVGETDPLRAVSRHVSDYRSTAESLESIGEKLGVRRIEKERLPFEGGIFSEGDQLVIKLNRLSTETRQKFTLAHELAHLMLLPEKATSARRCFDSTDLERACDCVAAELLMPLSEVEGITSNSPSIDTVMRIARRFGVSLQAAAVRSHQVGEWRHSIGFWRFRTSADELWYVGKRYWSTRKPTFIAFEMAMKGEAVTKTTEFYERADGLRPVRLEVGKIGREHVLALVLG